MQILNSLIPIFAVIGLGMLLRKREFLTADSTKAFNQFAYFFALPLFLFYKLGTASSSGDQVDSMVFTLITAVGATGVAAWLAGYLLTVSYTHLTLPTICSV